MQDLIVEGEQGWVLQGVLSRASFRRAAVCGQILYCIIAAHQQYLCEEKRDCQENHPDPSCHYDFPRR